jgi:hypothetical protein
MMPMTSRHSDSIVVQSDVKSSGHTNNYASRHRESEGETL